MDDSLLMARLTLMLLHASLQHPESLSAGYGVIILPSSEVLSQDQALRELAKSSGELDVSADVREGNLVITARELSTMERRMLETTASSFEDGIRRLNTKADPQAFIRATGFREQALVPARVVSRWLWSINCARCSMGIGLPGPEDPPNVVAVLHLGRTRK